MTKEDIQFLKDLQKLMRYEDEYDYDCQASPRFWVLRDYRTVPANEEYDDGFVQYFYNDGDFVEFNSTGELQEFVREFCEVSELGHRIYLSHKDIEFDLVWDWVQRELNDDGYFSSCFAKEEVFIVPNTMFLTKEEAKKHIELNKHHYTDRVHTYAMTAWRAPKVGRLLDILMDVDWDKVKVD